MIKVKFPPVSVGLVLWAAVLSAALIGVALPAAGGELSLAQAVNLATSHDPWQSGNRYQYESVQARSVAVGALPDPRISVGFANLPTDTFDFDQEAMTQFSVGVSQLFPRGESRALSREQLQQESRRYPQLAAQRRARVTATVSERWLDLYEAQASIRLVESSRGLFEELVDVTTASYASASGMTRQQDVIRAQLELTRLDEQLLALNQRRAVSEQQLREWLRSAPGELLAGTGNVGRWGPVVVPRMLPAVAPDAPILVAKEASDADIAQLLSGHPVVRALDAQLAAAETGVELVRQKYKPEWGVSASYGYRDDDPLAGARADFFSVGVSFDLPVFTRNRQDKQLRSAVADSQALRTRKWLMLREMAAQVHAARQVLLYVERRRQLYGGRLLAQMAEQAQASLTAYTNDDGSFPEVVRARIALLEAQIEALHIDVEQRRAIVALNYFAVRYTDSDSPQGPEDGL